MGLRSFVGEEVLLAMASRGRVTAAFGEFVLDATTGAEKRARTETALRMNRSHGDRGLYGIPRMPYGLHLSSALPAQNGMVGGTSEGHPALTHFATHLSVGVSAEF